MKKILMLSLDGIGITEEEKGNALKSANMPNFNSLIEKYPHSELVASGPMVGLPEGQAGNAIVGYSTIASGKILKQRSSFVHDFIDEDTLATNTELKSAIEHVQKNNSTFHVMGLMSSGGKCSNIDDVVKILEFLKKQDIKLGVDFIADGKDVETKSALKYIEQIESTGVPIISFCGRYYAMDEEGKWDRTKIYYDLVRSGIGLKVKELRLALKNCYIRNITDEYIPPILVEPDHNIKDNDVLFWVNFQEDGAIPILTALTNPDEVSEIPTKKLNNIKVLMMYPVDPKINATVLINEEEDVSNNLGLYLSKLDITQARIAAKDNYDFVTYYFNGESNDKLPKCSNYLVETKEKELDYESVGITKQIIRCMEKDMDFIIASFNAIEASGSSGKFNETVKSLEIIDECLGKIIESAELNFYTVVILSCFGSVESMIDEDEKAVTTHTTNKVPFIITDSKIKLADGALCDVAPTLLSYMDIGIPESMKESNVLIKE